MSTENTGVRMDGLLKADPRKIGGLRIDTEEVSQHALIRETLYSSGCTVVLAPAGLAASGRNFASATTCCH